MQEDVKNPDIVSQVLEAVQRFAKFLEPKKAWHVIAWIKLAGIVQWNKLLTKWHTGFDSTYMKYVY